MRSLPLLLLLAACTDRGTLLNDTDADTEARDPVSSVTFDPMVSAELESTDASWAVGDLDGDGAEDLVLTSPDGRIRWIRGGDPNDLREETLLTADQAKRSFAAQLRLSTEDITRVSVTWNQVADLDADGLDDVLQTVQIATDNEAFELTGVVYAPTVLPGWRTLIDADGPVRCDLVSDLDGDGQPELTAFGATSAVYTSGGEVWPLEGDLEWIWYANAGVLDTDEGPLLTVMINGGFGIGSMETYRLGADGLVRQEQVVEGLYASEAHFEGDPDRLSHSALLSDGQRVQRFDADGLHDELVSEDWLGRVSFGDFDGDGDLDLLSSDYESRQSTVFASAPAGPLSAIPTYVPEESLDADVRAIDFDGDGLDDLIGRLWVEGEDGPRLALWLNRGDDGAR